MNIIPAIDIIDKKVVRLEQGRFDKAKVYSNNPVDIAKKWKDCGAMLLHVVDLDGAKSGFPKNLDIVGDIVRNVKVEVELGGGLRDEKDVEEAFKLGVHYAIVGTSAVKDEEFCRRLIKRFGTKVVFAVDAKEGKLAIEGWKESSRTKVKEYIMRLEYCGATRVIYTDISRDGMMTGPNLETLKAILEITDLYVTVSGGISSIEDIKVLKGLEKEGVEGVIIGKALYEGKIDLAEAIRVS